SLEDMQSLLRLRLVRSALRDRQPVLVRELLRELHAGGRHPWMVGRAANASAHLRPELDDLPVEVPPRDGGDGKKLRCAAAPPAADLQREARLTLELRVETLEGRRPRATGEPGEDGFAPRATTSAIA